MCRCEVPPSGAPPGEPMAKGGRPTKVGPADRRGMEVPGYRKSPEAISGLSPEQHRMTQQGGTERPGTGEYLQSMLTSYRVSRCSPHPTNSSRSAVSQVSPSRSNLPTSTNCEKLRTAPARRAAPSRCARRHGRHHGRGEAQRLGHLSPRDAVLAGGKPGDEPPPRHRLTA